MLFHRKLCLIQIFFLQHELLQYFILNECCLNPVKIYPFEIFTRATPGSSLVYTMYTMLPYVADIVAIPGRQSSIVMAWEGSKQNRVGSLKKLHISISFSSLAQLCTQEPFFNCGSEQTTRFPFITGEMTFQANFCRKQFLTIFAFPASMKKGILASLEVP